MKQVISTLFFVALFFSLPCVAQEKGVAKPAVADSSIFVYVEQAPEFPGGKEALSNFLTQEVHYPLEALQKGIEGTVFLRFVVEKNGSISQVKVVKEVGGGCTEEAIRVVEKMPRWKPGTQNGKPVRVQFTLPLKFQLK